MELVWKGERLCSLVKAYDNFEVIWVKLVRGEEKYYIGGIYAPPDKGPYRGPNYFKDCLELLEVDCVDFRKDGKVLMGDFNARIGMRDSIIQGAGGPYTFARNVVDDDKKSCPARTRGIQLVESMNAVNMVIMNGIDSGGNFTFEHPNGSSIVDYIILSDNIILPGMESTEVGMDSRSEPIKANTPIPVDSIYIPNSFMVWSDYAYRIEDHFLISCKVVSSKPNVPMMPIQEVGQKLDIVRWVRRDEGNKDYWVPMQEALTRSLASWDLNLANSPFDSTNDC